DLLRARLPPAERDRVCTAYVGIPTALFRPEPPPPDGDRLRLVCVARFQEKKGLDTLVDGCALLRDPGGRVHLQLIGEGPQGPRAAVLKPSHVFVMPCRQDRTGDMDGIPAVFMEALATARPVVSCAVSG